jgi:hypothetical protein
VYKSEVSLMGLRRVVIRTDSRKEPRDRRFLNTGKNSENSNGSAERYCFLSQSIRIAIIGND